MTTIRLSNTRRALAVMVLTTAAAACSDNQPTAPQMSVPTQASAQLGGNPRPICNKCAPIGRILYVKGDPSAALTGHVWVMNADTTGQLQLTSGAGDDDYPAWSPDYQKVVFSTNRRGAYEIFIVNADGTGLAPVTTAVNGTRDEHPTWAPDGSKIYFSRSYSDAAGLHADIYSVNPGGSGLTKLTNSRGMSFFEPSVSPDGKKIVVTRLPIGAGWDFARIFTMNTNGAGLTQITFGAKGDASAAWSPDGTRLAFISNFGYPDQRDVSIVNADGTGLKTLVTWPGEQEHPSFSRDGTRIIYNDFSLNPNGWLMTVKPDGTGLAQVEATNDLGSYYDPSWSR